MARQVPSRDREQTRQLLVEAVGRVLAQLPDAANQPQVVKADSDGDPVMRIAVTSDQMTTAEITDYVDRYAERIDAVTADDVRRYQLPQAVRLRPDLVTLSVGPNDITGRRPLADYRRDVEEILRTLAEQTTAVVVVNLIPDLGVTPRFRGKEIEPRVRERVLAFNEALHRAARVVGGSDGPGGQGGVGPEHRERGGIDIVLEVRVNENLHDREIRLDNGWIIKLGRGLDFYQKPESWFAIGASDFSLRKCLETKVDIFRADAS